MNQDLSEVKDWAKHVHGGRNSQIREDSLCERPDVEVGLVCPWRKRETRVARI